jgi:uncharacterized damage-inducible protein DinB
MSLAYLRSHWAEVRAGLEALIGQIEPEDLEFRPFEGAYSVRELLLHVAHEELGEVQCGITGSLPKWPLKLAAAEHPRVEDVVAALDIVHSGTVAYLETAGDHQLDGVVKTPWGTSATLRQLLGHVIEHETHHRGELSLMLGMLGKEEIDA